MQRGAGCAVDVPSSPPRSLLIFSLPVCAATRHCWTGYVCGPAQAEGQKDSLVCVSTSLKTWRECRHDYITLLTASYIELFFGDEITYWKKNAAHAHLCKSHYFIIIDIRNGIFAVIASMDLVLRVAILDLWVLKHHSYSLCLPSSSWFS